MGMRKKQQYIITIQDGPMLFLNYLKSFFFFFFTVRGLVSGVNKDVSTKMGSCVVWE